MVVLGDFQAVEDAPFGSNRGEFNWVARGEEGRPPVVDKAFIDYDKALNIIEFLVRWLPMQGYEIFLVLGKCRKIGVQYSDPPYLE